VKGSLENLYRVYRQSNGHDWAVARESYPKYQRLTFAIAQKYGFAGHIGAAVFAALSPNNDYLGNLRDTDRVLKAAGEGRDIDSFKVSTYGNNKRKAWQIASGADPLDMIIAKKTRNFYLNIKDPNDPQPCTIDGHMYWIWMGRRGTMDEANVNGSNYEVIAECVRELARREGIVTSLGQAILWQTWKRIHNVLYDGQIHLWDREVLQAGLGWEMVQRTGFEPMTLTVSG
jgi:hypothetical protein